MAAGGAQPNLNLGRIKEALIPLPPLAEVKRIVVKVDRLMALCDELEARQEKQHKRILQLGEVATSQLLTTSTPEAFNQHWQGICDNFDLLYSTPENVSQMRQAILQLAVMGKLVPQDPNDESASVLLERIKEEKAQLVKEGKIKKTKPQPPVEADEVPFKPPSGWKWIRLESLVEVITKGSSPKWQGVNYVSCDLGVLFVTSENVRNYFIDLTEPKFVELRFNEIEPRSILKRNDILMNIVGASIGRTAIYDRDKIANINQAVCLIRMIGPQSLINLSYMLHFFNSAICIDLMLDKQVDNARANLSMGNIAKFPIPLPPLNEQKRIVAKVDQLMSLCEELESKLKQSISNREKLMEIAVRQVLAA